MPTTYMIKYSEPKMVFAVAFDFAAKNINTVIATGGMTINQLPILSISMPKPIGISNIERIAVNTCFLDKKIVTANSMFIKRYMIYGKTGLS